MNQQQKVILAAGASAAVILLMAFLLYRKRKDSDEEDINETESEVNKYELEFADLNATNSLASAGQTVIELKVPSRVVGSIIGKRGTNIKQLKAEFGVRFDFDQDDNKENQPSDRLKQKERTLSIRGEREKVYAAEERIKTIIAERPPPIETEVLVPQQACGRIIGKEGKNIREMCNISGAQICLDRNEDRSLECLRRVNISGTPMQVDYAKLLIEEKVEHEKADRIKFNRSTSVEKALVSNFLKDFPMISLPEECYFPVFVCAFDTPDHIWVQLVSQESSKLDLLTMELTEVYGALSEKEERLEQGKIGNICVAPFQHDGDWYRACVTRLYPDRTLDVYYIDFGDNGKLNIDQIKMIRSEHLNLPAHAVECYLPVKSSGLKWTTSAIDDFNELSHHSQWIPLMAKILCYKEVSGKRYPVLELIDTSQEKEVNISSALVEKGHALELPNDNCDIPCSSEESFNNNTLTKVENEVVLGEKKNGDEVDAINKVVENNIANYEVVLVEKKSGDEVIVNKVINENVVVDNVVDVESRLIDLNSFNVNSVVEEPVLLTTVNLTDVEAIPTNADSILENVEAVSTSSNVKLGLTDLFSPDVMLNEFIKDDADLDSSAMLSDNDTATSRNINSAKIFVEENTISESNEDDVKNHFEDGFVAKPLSVDTELVDTMIKEERSDIALNAIQNNEDNVNNAADVEESVQSSVGNVAMAISGNEVSDKSASSTRLPRESSFDDFVDIDVKTVDGAITAIVSAHIPRTDDRDVESDVHPDDQTITNEVTYINDLTLNETYSDVQKSFTEDAVGNDDHIDSEITSEESSVPEVDMCELQKSLDETSRKNVSILSSMELTCENLLSIDDDSDSFFSVRSKMTITDTDNMSFFSANDRLTPINDISVSIPDLSVSPDSSQLDLAPTQNNSKRHDPKRLSNSGSTFEIQFIDEKSNRVMSREALHSSFECLADTRNVKKKESMGKETTV